MLNTQGLQALGQHPLPPAQRAIINAYAHFCAPDGSGAYPAVATLAAKTGYSERHVRRVVRELVSAGLLVADGWGPKGTRKYAVACPPPDTMSAESSSSRKDSKETLFYYDSWRTRVRPFEKRTDKPMPTARLNLHETTTARALMATGLAAGEALRYGWVDETQAAEVIALATKKAQRGELRASKSAYVLGALRRIEEGEQARHAADVQAGVFTGNWDEYREMLAAVQNAPARPEKRPAPAPRQADGYAEIDDWGEMDEAEVDEVYGWTPLQDTNGNSLIA